MVTSPEPSKTFSAIRRPELDAVRGLAILMVLSLHYYVEKVQFAVDARSALDYLHRVLAMGWAGVDLFFVLSGFLIGGILIDQRGGANYFTAFFVRRACRILPAYLVLLISFIVVKRLHPGAENPPWDWLFRDPLPLWSYFSFTQNCFFPPSAPAWLAVTWSLAVEEQFYLFLPFLVRKLDPRQLPLVAGLLVLVAIVVRMALIFAPGFGGIAGYQLLPCRWDALFLGVLAAYLVRRPGFLPACREYLWAWISALGVLTAGALVFAYGRQGVATNTMTTVGHTWFAGLFFTAIIVALTLPAGSLKSLFFNAPLRWLGTYSYGVYLFHLPILGLCHALILNQSPRIATWTDAGVTLAAITITLIFSVISYHVMEKKFLKLGHRWNYQGR